MRPSTASSTCDSYALRHEQNERLLAAAALRGARTADRIEGDSGPLPAGTMARMARYPHEWRDYEPIQPRSGWDWRARLRKLWAPLAALGAFLAKFGVVLLKFKFLFSMFVSAAFYVWLGGWWFGIGLIALVIYMANPILIIILLLAGSELRRRWQLRRIPQMQDYYRVRPHQRLIIGLLYFGLAATLVLGMHATHVPHSF